MSQDDSNTPTAQSTGSSSRTSARTGSSSLTKNVPLLAGLALLLVAGIIAFVVLGGDDDGAASDCVREEVRLTTAPAMESLVEQAVKAFEADEPCIDVALTAGTVKDVVALLNDPEAEMPELWIPDSPTWKGQLGMAGWSGTPIAEVVAETPVGLVTGPSGNAPNNWAAAMASGRVVLSDPSSNGASALALLAPAAEAKQAGAPPANLKDIMVPLAQSYGERAAAKDTSSADLDAVTATSSQLIPATEKDYLTARRGNDQLSLLAPKSGVPMLRFPVIDVNRGGIDVLGSGRDVSARVGRAITRWFGSGEGQAAVVEAEFRTPGAKSLAGDVGMGSAKVLDDVDQKTTDDTLRDWRVLAVPSSVRAVIDLSGSMKTNIGDGSRIELAANAAKTGLDALPDNARLGVWGFSKNRGENNTSWEELAPLLPLNEAVDGGTHRQAVEKLVPTIPSKVRGATAVMDTVLAAYKDAQANWDPAYFSSVVIFTDGASDDSSSMKIDDLVQQLENVRDPSKPVRVIVMGISQDANTPELAQIAKATGGQNYLVLNANDMLGALASALLNR